jgi:predicted transcriptional regulator
MDEQKSQSDELLAFFKALADANRLKIIGLLAQEPYSVEQLAELLKLKPSTVSHHLSRLSEIGLVSARSESYYNIYSLHTDELEAMARRMLSRETLPDLAEDVDQDAYERKVLISFLDEEGRITTLPSQRKKFVVLLKHVAGAFEFGFVYDEKEVTEILSRFSDDPVSLRRGLIDFKFMERKGDGSAYWLLEPPSTQER